jgi:Ca2+-binding EF-hand superfamily protein
MDDADLDEVIQEQIALLRAAFDHFDVDGDGLLDAAELAAALRAVGQEVGHEELRKLIASVDEDRDAAIGFAEFVDLVEPRPVGDDPDADLREAFAVLDADGDGFLDRGELSRAGSGELGDGVAERVIAAVDADGDGRISYAEFASWMQRG